MTDQDHLLNYHPHLTLKYLELSLSNQNLLFWQNVIESKVYSLLSNLCGLYHYHANTEDQDIY